MSKQGKSMNSVDARYIVFEGSRFGTNFVVWDQKEKKCICSCAVRKNADLIADTLSNVWRQIEDEEAAAELGG